MARYKRACVRHDGPFRTVGRLEFATLRWVDWFNHDRLHGETGHRDLEEAAGLPEGDVDVKV